jgi:hypothetical protein
MGETLVIIVRTLTCTDGIIGLNDWQYLLNVDNTLMTFKDEETAKEYLTEHGESLEELEFVTLDDVGLPNDVPVVNNTLGSL